jgi:uncharacterized oxidoreductase
VIDLARLGDPAAIRAGAAASADYIKSSRVAPGFDGIQLPGDPERRSAARRREDGIPIDDTSWSEILAAARKVGVPEEQLRAVSG